MSKVRAFMNQVLSIEPRGMNVFGTGIPGVSGSSMAGRGGSTEADVINSLNNNAHNLASLIASRADNQSITSQKQLVETDLRTCNVIGLVTDTELDNLMADLNDL